MRNRAAIDSSPLIYLARIGRLDLMQLAGAPIIAPRQVVDEIARGVPTEPALAEVHSDRRFEIVEVPQIDARVEGCNIDLGEAAVSTFALTHSGCVAVIDELMGMRCGLDLGVRVIGTLGLILKAKQLGIIAGVEPIIVDLRGAGFRVADRLIAEVLMLAGEH